MFEGCPVEVGQFVWWLWWSPALLPASHCSHRSSLCRKVRERREGIFLIRIISSKDPADYRVSLGDHHIRSVPSPVDSNEVRLDIEEFIVHPEFRM